MPIGLNLDIDFDTQASQPDKSTYPFFTGSGPAPPAPLGTFNAYQGLSCVGRFYNYTEFNFGVCEYYPTTTDLNILEYNQPCPESFFVHTHSVEFELTTDRRILQNINLHLCEYAANAYDGDRLIFEYIDLCAELGFHYGSKFTVALTLAGRDLGQRYDLALCCPYQRPELSENRIEFEYDPPCEQWHVLAASGAMEVDDLTVYPRNYTNTNIDLCGNDKFNSTTRPVISSLDQELPDDSNLDRVINFSSHEWEYHFDGGCPDFPFQANAVHEMSMVFEFTIDKGFQYDLKLCPNETNPPADCSEYEEGELHLFEFEPDYDYPCEKFELDFYHGAYVVTDVFEEVVIEGVEAFSGAFSDAGMQNNVRFYGDGYHGAVDSYDLTVPKPADVGHDHYSGATLEAELLTVQIFYDVDGYHGAYTDGDLEVPKPAELEAPAWHGHNVADGLLTEPIFQMETAYHGHNIDDIDFTIFPAIEVEGDAYHGGTLLDTILVTSQIFVPDAYHGGYGDLDFTTFESEGIGVVDNPHGGHAEATMNVTFALYADGYGGAYAEFENLSFPTVFEIDVYGGEYADTDFSTFGPPTLDGDVYHGGYMEDFEMNVTKALYPRAFNGAYADTDFTDAPAQEISIDAYHGGNGVLDELDEEDWNMWNYHGSNVDAEVNIQVNMPADGYHGQYVEDLDLNYEFVALQPETGHGIYSIITAVGFEVPEGEALTFTGYHGALCEAFPTILIHETFKVRFVHDYAMYDGFGGVGGLNHCPTEHLSCATPFEDNCVDPDATIRFDYPLNGNLAEYESDLNIIFDETGFLPWNPCNQNHGMGYLEVDLHTRPRLDVEFTHGHSTEVFMKRELTSFGEVPLDILYSENGEGGRQDHIDTSWLPRTFEVEFNYGDTAIGWWDEPESATGWTGHSIDFELTQVPLWDSIAAGISAEVGFLAVERPHWFQFIHAASVGHDIWLDFDPTDYLRFCPGYIVPVGNNVVFEFASVDNTDCLTWQSYGGASAAFELSALPQGASRNYGGEYARASLSVQKIWLLRGYHGHNVRAYIPSTVDFVPREFAHGSWMRVGFEVLPIIGAHGYHLAFDELTVTGPAVEWVTPEGCLPNEYIPLTIDGDPDYAAILPDPITGIVRAPNVPVERLNYLTPLLATCITYVPPDEEEEP